MKVVVTGGAGFVGAGLCGRLARDGRVDEVVALDNLTTGLAANLDGVDATLVEGSVLDGGVLDSVIRDADAVVHLAARPSVPRSLTDPLATHHANATGTLEVIEAVRRAKGPHLIVASSSSVYGANRTLPKHEGLAPAPASPYAASKLAAESYALAAAHSFGLDVMVFRFFNVFGPLQTAGHAYAAVIPAFVSAAVSGRPLIVHGDGLQSRDFTYIDSVTAVLADAIHRRVTAPGPVNLAFGSNITLKQVISRIGALVDVPLVVEYTDARPGDVRHSQADQTALRSLFPSLEPTPFEDGLAATVRWFKAGYSTLDHV